MMDRSAFLHYIFSPWVVAGSVLLGLALAAGVLLALWVSRPGPSAAAPATAVLQIIPIPTPTPTQPTPTATVPPTPLPGGAPLPPPGDIALGAYVQITGTGGDGLRMRSEPGLNGNVLFLGLESEVFIVEEGPRSADGYTWWFVSAPYDPNVRGWAVANYLQVVQNP